MEVTATGFKVVNATGMTVNVQDHLEQNFKLAIGSVSESVTVEAGSPLVDTDSAAVSTVVDRQFAENLPLNGRSFQTLIQLTPGVVLSTSTGYDPGQFSVNGQRATSNYWTVDGVSANIGVGASGTPGSGIAGALPSFSAQGGTNSLVSVDALQEFRVQTSTYAPEFGRTSGGQISIVTRSGANQFHGAAFDYLRNDALDANNWFNGYVNNPPLPKAEERQNDFGGTLSGPILKDRTFFFFSYEGLRLRLPQTALSTVPDLSTRQNAVPAMQPFLNAYPRPNGPEILLPDQNGVPQPTGSAEFNTSFSDPSTLDASSIRIDHRLTDKLSLFSRYNYSPSEIVQRGGGGSTLSVLQSTRINTQTLTVGGAWIISPTLTSDLRFNYSRSNATTSYTANTFGGAVPLTASNLPLPTPFTLQNSAFQFGLDDLVDGFLNLGQNAHNVQRQFNTVYNLSVQKGPHAFKLGVDYRRLTPSVTAPAYVQATSFATEAAAAAGQIGFALLATSQREGLILHNLGLFAQDTWHAQPRLTITYGLRWDVDFAPETSSGPSLPAVVNFDDPSSLALAPVGTPPFRTRYGNLAPRIGVAYQLSQSQDWQTVLRGGFGVFYDLATTELGNTVVATAYPFGGYSVLPSGNYPSDVVTAPLPVTSPTNLGYAFDPNLKLPYSLQWSVAFQQALGKQQTISASYIGSAARRLIQTEGVFNPDPNFTTVYLVGNHGTSDYDAFQLQFQRRLSHGLQALASYTLAHSIDTASTSSIGEGDSLYFSQLGAIANRGPSDFDVRNAVSAAVTYDLPFSRGSTIARAILRGWSAENILQAQSALPVDVFYSFTYSLYGNFQYVRPDVVPGVPFYLHGSPYPGGKAFNIAAFAPPPIDPTTGAALRQGNLSRNALRAFGFWQWDFAVHREFTIHDALKLQFRAEMFNALNHPNFGPPYGNLSSPAFFGLSNQMLGQSLSGGNVGGGGFSPLYQTGGPRSIQLALKLQF